MLVAYTKTLNESCNIAAVIISWAINGSLILDRFGSRPFIPILAAGPSGSTSVPMFPELSAAQVKALMGKLMGTHGKVIITWNPRDKLPAFPPQVEQEEVPFMLNATVKPEIHAGSFNQTLKY